MLRHSKERLVMTKQRIPSSTAVAELEPDCFDSRAREVIQALLTAGALVALADGRVRAVEREEAVNYIDQQALFSAIPRSKIAEAFDHHARRLLQRGSPDVIMEALRPPAGSSSASLVLGIAEHVAAADRQIHRNELSTLKLLELISIMPPVRPGTLPPSS
jgi:tellurite resistance protein TerB